MAQNNNNEINKIEVIREINDRYTERSDGG